MTGFEGGVQFYDPSGLSFLNTLSTLTPGHGYWVKVEPTTCLKSAAHDLTRPTCLACLKVGTSWATRRKHLPRRAPSLQTSRRKGTRLCDGLRPGVQVYDPNGLSFLNTLTEIRNGFGYWVKSAVATEGDVLLPCRTRCFLQPSLLRATTW